MAEPSERPRSSASTPHEAQAGAPSIETDKHSAHLGVLQTEQTSIASTPLCFAHLKGLSLS